MIIEKLWKQWLEYRNRWIKYLERNCAFLYYHAPFFLSFPLPSRTCMFICCYIEPGTTGLSKNKCNTYLLAQCKQCWWLIKTKQFTVNSAFTFLVPKLASTSVVPNPLRNEHFWNGIYQSQLNSQILCLLLCFHYIILSFVTFLL